MHMREQLPLAEQGGSAGGSTVQPPPPSPSGAPGVPNGRQTGALKGYAAEPPAPPSQHERVSNDPWLVEPPFPIKGGQWRAEESTQAGTDR